MEDHVQESGMTVRLVMTPEIDKKLKRLGGCVTVAEAYTITNHAEAEMAASDLKVWKRNEAVATEMFEDFVRPAKEIIENARKWFVPVRDDARLATSILAPKLIAYQDEQHRLADQMRREADEKERVIRQKAEQDAAAARAAAQETERIAKKAEQDAEKERQAAIAAGNAVAAQEAAERAAKARSDAAAAIENGEAEAVSATLTASASVQVIEAPAAIAGFSTRKNWKAEPVVSLEEARDKILAAIIAGRHDLASLLMVDEKAANAVAKAYETKTAIPGMRAVNKSIGVRK